MAGSFKTSRLIEIIFSCFVFLNFDFINGKRGLGDLEQEWGHITVRPHVHMFWWLFFTTAEVSNFTERPLIIWLQGGPGMPSSGYGNFIEIGPLDLDLQPRQHSWAKNFNLLFIDSPADVGFSYFSNEDKNYSKNVEEIGRDLVSFIKKFLNQFKEFREVPLYIFGESYGGKVAVEFAYQLHQKMKNRNIANFKGIGLGGAHISPIDYTRHYAPLLYNLGILDNKSYIELTKIQRKVENSITKGNYHFASKMEVTLASKVNDLTYGIDFYNFDRESNHTSLPNFLQYEDTCNNFMNTIVRKSLNISQSLTWNYINTEVYHALLTDIMKPVTSRVEALLDESDIKVIIFNGVFDLIVNAVGTTSWIERLNWKGKKEWNYNASNKPLQINFVNQAYVKRVDNLVYYTVFRAGHSVPIDNPIAMEEILKNEILQSDPS